MPLARWTFLSPSIFLLNPFQIFSTGKYVKCRSQFWNILNIKFWQFFFCIFIIPCIKAWFLFFVLFFTKLIMTLVWSEVFSDLGLHVEIDPHGKTAIYKLTHWGLNIMANILQMTFSNIFSMNAWSLIRISLTYIPKGPIVKKSALVQVMAWRRTGDKPLSEAVLTKTHDAIGHSELTLDTRLNYSGRPWSYWSCTFTYLYIYQGDLLRPWPQKLAVFCGQCWHLDPPFTCAVSW